MLMLEPWRSVTGLHVRTIGTCIHIRVESATSVVVPRERQDGSPWTMTMARAWCADCCADRVTIFWVTSETTPTLHYES